MKESLTCEPVFKLLECCTVFVSIKEGGKRRKERKIMLKKKKKKKKQQLIITTLLSLSYTSIRVNSEQREKEKWVRGLNSEEKKLRYHCFKRCVGRNEC